MRKSGDLAHSNSNSQIKTTSLSKGRIDSKSRYQNESDCGEKEKNKYKNETYLNKIKNSNTNKSNNFAKKDTIKTSTISNKNYNSKNNILKTSQNSAEKIKYNNYANKDPKNYKRDSNIKISECKENGSTLLSQQTMAVPYYYNNMNIIAAVGAPTGNAIENTRLNTGNSLLNHNNSNQTNYENNEAKNLGNNNNFRRVKQDGYKNCLLDKVHKKTAGKYMIVDYNTNSEEEKERSGSKSCIAKKV